MTKRKDGEPSITQSDADKLIQMPKFYFGQKSFVFPEYGRKICFSLHSRDKRTEFVFTCNSTVMTLKYSFQNRTKCDNIILVRLDLNPSDIHTNPDDSVVRGSHVHIYREGYGDRFATPLPGSFNINGGAFVVFSQFLEYCNVLKKPILSEGIVYSAGN